MPTACCQGGWVPAVLQGRVGRRLGRSPSAHSLSASVHQPSVRPPIPHHGPVSATGVTSALSHRQPLLVQVRGPGRALEPTLTLNRAPTPHTSPPHSGSLPGSVTLSVHAQDGTGIQERGGPERPGSGSSVRCRPLPSGCTWSRVSSCEVA